MSNPYTELKNIKYKNMLLSNNNKESINSSQSTINDFLEKEREIIIKLNLGIVLMLQLNYKNSKNIVLIIV